MAGRRQAWAAQLGNPVNLNRIAIAADVALSSTTAGADLLKRIEELEAQLREMGKALALLDPKGDLQGILKICADSSSPKPAEE